MNHWDERHPNNGNGTSQKIAELSIVVDKMHMAGHMDAWCKKPCDSWKVKDLDNVSYCSSYILLQSIRLSLIN